MGNSKLIVLHPKEYNIKKITLLILTLLFIFAITLPFASAEAYFHTRTLSGHKYSVSAVAFKDDSTLISVGTDSILRFWNLDTGAQHWDAEVGLFLISDIAISSHDSRFVVYTGGLFFRPYIGMSYTDDGDIRGYLTGHTNTVNTLSFKPGSSTLASGSDDDTIRIWDLTWDAWKSRPVRTLRGHRNNVESVAWSPDGTLLASGSRDWSVRSENPIRNDSTSVLNAPRFVGNVVLENMYEDEAGKLASKTPLEIITVLEGTGKVSLQARFRAVKDGPYGLPVYECELIDESAEVARGMSGSPVGPPGRVMGALAFGYIFSKPPYRFLVTPIDYMETAINHPTFGEFLNEEAAPAAPALAMNAMYAPVKTPLIMTGIQPHRIPELSSHLSGSKFDFVELLGDIDGTPAAPPANATTKLFAGDMIGAAVVTGDVTSLIGFGTVTQVYDDKFIAFGHPFFADGKSALPVYRAVTHGIVSNLTIASKSVSAYGNPIGTITKDLHPAVVGELGPGPAMIPVKVSYHPVNNTPIEKHHLVAYGQEWALSYVAAVTMDAIRMEQNAATVEGTVTLHFQETETVYTEKFRTASSNPFFAVFQKTGSIIDAFTDILGNSAGKATLKAVSVSIVDKPQIATAEIDEIIVPAEVMPGENLTVSVVLLPHWSTAGAERIIQKEVILNIPDGFLIGEANLTVSAADESTDDTEFTQLFGDIFDELLGEEEEEDEKPLPRNLDELIRQKEEDQMDAGLITITVTPSAFGGGFPLPEGFSLPDDSEEQPIEIELIVEGFIVTGSKEAQIMIKVGNMEAGVPAQ